MRKLLQSAFVFGLLLISIAVTAQDNIGIASYYSDSYHGRRTASGELYDKGKLTAAHKTHPFGTYLKVTRLDNKRSVTVKVNDRGPYIKGRIVDLSRKAAEALDIVKDGQATVKIEVVPGPQAGEVAATAPVNIEAPVTTATTPPSFDQPEPVNSEAASLKKKEETASTPPPKPKVVETPAATPVKKDPKAASTPFAPGDQVVRGKDYKDFDLYKIQVIRPERTGFGVQVGSFTNYQNVLKQVAELQDKWFNNILLSIEPGAEDKPLYKTILGPFPDRATAESYKNDLKKKKKITGFVVDLKTEGTAKQ